MEGEEFEARRIGDVPSGSAQLSRLLSEGVSLFGGGPSCSATLVSWAEAAARVHPNAQSSPRFARERALASLRSGCGGVLCSARGGVAAGGALFLYEATANVGIIFDFVSGLSLDSRASRGQALRMLRVVLDKLIAIMDEEAILNGQLAGCNAIFFVSRGSRDPHRLLLALKCYCLDFPLEGFLNDEPEGGVALGLVMTQQVPLTPVIGGSLEDGGKFYVPAIVLERFFRLQSALGDLLGLDLKSRLVTQLAKLSVRSKIPTVPWSREQRWMVVNLREDYDEALLRGFHRMASEVLDPLSVQPLTSLQEALQDDDDSRFSTHVFVVLYWSTQRSQFDIVGGMQVGFFPKSNTGIIQCWFLARSGKSHNRRHEVMRVLTRVLEDMRAHGVPHGHIAGLDGLFFEAPFNANAAELDVGADHLLMSKIGFRKVQMDYGTPEGRSCLLLVLTDDNTPRSEFDPRLMFLPEVLVRETLQERWAAVSDEMHAPRDLLRQVRMQEERGVPLLDLPWSGSDALSGVLVDLYDDWDEALATSLYNSLPAESVEPFHVWRSLMAEDFGVSPQLSASRARTLSNPPNPPVLGSGLTSSNPSSKGNLLSTDDAVFELHALVRLTYTVNASVGGNANVNASGSIGIASSNSSSRSDLNSSVSSFSASGAMTPVKSASSRNGPEGMLMHYYPRSNCGVISHLQVPLGRPVGPMLDKARDIFDRCARERGFLSGANMVFLEIAAEHVGKIRVEDFHRALRDANFRLVGCQQYEAPKRTAGPWSRHKDELQVPLNSHVAKGTILLAFRGEFVPIDNVLGDFLPSNVVRGFVIDRWRGAWESGLMGEQPDGNPAFVQMLQSLSAVAKLPLRDLPWSAQSSDQWVYVNLGRNYDEGLLTSWYDNVLKPNFPLEDEVESLDSFKKGLLADPNDDDAMLLEMILAVRWEGGEPVIGGGVVYEYYFDSNCGLISFLVVGRIARGQGLSRILVEMAAQELDVLSVDDGGALAGCNCIFLETNAAQAITMEQDVMDPRLRHLIYHKMGFKLVDFPYVMPPLGLGMPKVYYLLLLVYMTHKIPSDPILDERYLPGVLLQRFFHDQWKHAQQYGRLAAAPEQDPDYAVTMNALDFTQRVPLRDYPWVKSRPWTIIDMRVHNDPELLAQVLAAIHDVYPAEARADFPEAEFCKSLQSEVDPSDNSATVWQAVAGLMPPRLEDVVALDALQLDLVAILLLQYDPVANIGRIVFDCARSSTELEMSQDLLDRGVAQVQSSAIGAGHLGGCSAVLVSVSSEEDSLLGPVTGMQPVFTRATAAALGFLEVMNVQLKKGETLLVLDTPDIPKAETGGSHLPARLMTDFARMQKVPSTVVEQLSARRFFPLRKVETPEK